VIGDPESTTDVPEALTAASNEGLPGGAVSHAAETVGVGEEERGIVTANGALAGTNAS
jgi:hypothetical protein